MKLEVALSTVDIRSLGLVPASGPAASSDPADGRQKSKLVDGARQFEAMMLEQMLKPLHFCDSPDEAGGTKVE